MNHDDQYVAARSLVDDPCNEVASISRSLLCQMLKRNDSPQGGFNFLYFFQAVIRVWLTRQPEVVLRNTLFPIECHSINGINWPHLSTSANQLTTEFVDLVKCESVAFGAAFDVGYAVSIVDSLVDGSGNLRTFSVSELNDLESDYWLAGFNSHQP